MMHRTKKKNDENSGKWIGIGGKFCEGESPEDCVRREALEETGITLSDWNYRGIVTFASDVYETEHMHLFTAHSHTAEVTDCDEGELAWIEKDQILSFNLWEGDKILLKLIEDEKRPFFSLKLSYRGEKLISAIYNGREDIYSI